MTEQPQLFKRKATPECHMACKDSLLIKIMYGQTNLIWDVMEYADKIKQTNKY